MTQLSGTEPVATDPAAATQPAPAPAPAAAETLREDQMAVDKSAFAPFGGDYHEAIRKASMVAQAEEQWGLPFETLMESMSEAVNTTENPPADTVPPAETPTETPTETPPAEAPAAMTEEAMTALLDKRDATRAETEATEGAERDRVSTETQVAQDKGRHVIDALKVIGVVPNEKGEWPKSAKTDQRLYDGFLQDALAADIPSWAVSDEEAVEKFMYRTTPTAAQVATALTDLQAYFADRGHKAVADFATGQTDVPGATVGPGAGGGAPQKTVEEMTQQEKREAITDQRDFTGVNSPG